MKKIQYYGLATPNGQKVSILLEELGVEYDAHTINILEGDQFKPDYIKISPNSKIPGLVDPQGPNGEPISIMESGAIMLYLAQKYQRFFPTDEVKKSQCLQWLCFQVGHIGPMFGQFGHFYKYAKDKCDHPYPLERYANESKRLLQVLDDHLQNNDYMVKDEYTIADIAIFPWVNCLSEHYDAQDFLNLKQFENVTNWVNKCNARDAVIKGRKICEL